ncbi:porin [Roseateles sp. BYS78W]|uniref:Porin n=1 Tax=Pelomonas candidula TaxID=3299025 RepID=A0ABW7HCV1_9BURK
MKKTVLCMAVLAAFAGASPAFADELADLKAEIAAQKQAAAAQKARLDALEQKLANVQQSAAAPAAAPATTGTGSTLGGYKLGDGLSIGSANGFVTLYGLIDVSYVHTNHADANGSNVTSPRVAWFSGNRWGLFGSRKMGDSGLNVIFRLESEFESQTGNMDTDNVLFNRDAWVGVESKDFGKLTLGRQNAIARDPASSAIYGDPYGPAAPSTEEGGYSNNNNFKQLIFYAGSATGTRINNGVVWKKAFSNGLLAAVQYQFGGVPGDFSKGSTETVSLAYAGGSFNLAGFVTNANVAGLTNRTYSVGGNVQIGDVRLNSGVFHYTAEQGAAGALGKRTDNAYTLSAKWTPGGGPMDYALGYQNMKANNAAVNGSGNVLNAYANASGATAVATGSRSTLYTSASYHFDKITEVYAAMDYLKLKDGYKFGATNGAPNQTEFALGLRMKF